MVAVEAAVGTQAEVFVQHLSAVEVAADTVLVVELGHYWEAVVVVESKTALVLVSWQCLESEQLVASTPAVAVAVE